MRSTLRFLEDVTRLSGTDDVREGAPTLGGSQAPAGIKLHEARFTQPRRERARGRGSARQGRGTMAGLGSCREPRAQVLDCQVSRPSLLTLRALLERKFE